MDLWSRPRRSLHRRHRPSSCPRKCSVRIIAITPQLHLLQCRSRGRIQPIETPHDLPVPRNTPKPLALEILLMLHHFIFIQPTQLSNNAPLTGFKDTDMSAIDTMIHTILFVRRLHNTYCIITKLTTLLYEHHMIPPIDAPFRIIDRPITFLMIYDDLYTHFSNRISAAPSGNQLVR